MSKAGADEPRGGSGRALQRRATGESRLVPRKREAFLGELAKSCNVLRAGEAAGASAQSFYRLRQRDTAFAAAWEEALATGYARLEAELLAEALREGGGPGDAQADGRAPIDRDLALALLGRRDAKARSTNPGGYGRMRRTHHVPMAEVEAALMRQLRLLAKRTAERA